MATADLSIICAVSARVFGVFVCLPISDAIQILPRLFLALCFALPLSLQIEPSAEVSWHTPLAEFLVGLIIASPIRVFAEAAEMLGELLDTARGQTIGSVIDPLNGQQVSDMATLLRIASTVLVIQVGGFDRVVEAVRVSYSHLPLAGPIVAEGFLRSILHRGFGIVASACALSSVWLLAYLLSDLAASLLGKVTQGLSFTSTASIVKMVFTIILLLNLLWQPGQVTALARRASRAMAIHPLSADQLGGLWP